MSAKLHDHTTGALARAAGCSVTTIRALTAKGVIVPIRDSAGRHLYTEDAVDAVLRALQRNARRSA